MEQDQQSNPSLDLLDKSEPDGLDQRELNEERADHCDNDKLSLSGQKTGAASSAAGYDLDLIVCDNQSQHTPGAERMSDKANSSLESSLKECSYCGQQNLETLVKCVDSVCQKWFCNGYSDVDKGGSQKESHIVTHLRASKHRQIGVASATADAVTGEIVTTYEEIAFRCAGDGCSECDAFDLGMETGGDGRNCDKHFCSQCAIKMKKITTTRRPFVDTHHRGLTCISESIAKVPSQADLLLCRSMTPRAMADLERSWLISASGIGLPGKDDPTVDMKMRNTFSSSDDYYNHFISLVNLDLSLTRMESATIPKLEHLTITQRDTNRTSLWLEFQTRSQIHKRALQCGQPVLVYLSTSPSKDPVKATVKFNRDSNNLSTIRVEFSVQAGRAGVVLPEDGIIAVEVEFQDTAYSRQLGALKHFEFISPVVKGFLLGSSDLLLHSEKNPPYTGSLFEVPGRKLNSSQEAAVRLSLSTTPFSLIQGPPGTGKTHTIVAIVANLLHRNRNVRVHCCAPSNDPTDHLAVQLANSGIKVLRIHSGRTGSKEMPKELRVLTLRYQLEQRMGLNYERQFNKNRVDSNIQDIVNEAQVVCTTCNTAVCRALTLWPPSEYSSVLVIDEATQATEADALIPITKHFDKVIMIGDHKQLGVVNRFRDLERTNLGCSLFERLIRAGQVPSILLDTQYRMHPQICAPASAVMYDGRLQTGHDVAAVREAAGDPLQFLHLSERFSPLVMVDIATLHELASDRVSTVNLHEALVVTLCLVNFLHRKIKPEDIGVITFYNGQKEFLKKAIANHSCIPDSVCKRLMIDSVDAFQGREKDYIILSCVRSGDAENTSIGFLLNKRRLNVALTRAKKGVLAVGDRTLLETCREWREFLQDYLHVKEEDAFLRLGVHDVRRPSCHFCEDAGKRSTNLLEPPDSAIPDITKELIHLAELPCTDGDETEMENIHQHLISTLAPFSLPQKMAFITNLFSVYYCCRDSEKTAILCILMGAIGNGVLPVDIIEESFYQQLILTEGRPPWYPGLAVALMGSVLVAGYLVWDQLHRVFQRASSGFCAGTSANADKYHSLFRTWLDGSAVSAEKKQDLLGEMDRALSQSTDFDKSRSSLVDEPKTNDEIPEEAQEVQPVSKSLVRPEEARKVEPVSKSPVRTFPSASPLSVHVQRTGRLDDRSGSPLLSHPASGMARNHFIPRSVSSRIGQLDNTGNRAETGGKITADGGSAVPVPPFKFVIDPGNVSTGPDGLGKDEGTVSSGKIGTDCGSAVPVPPFKFVIDVSEPDNVSTGPDRLGKDKDPMISGSAAPVPPFKFVIDRGNVPLGRGGLGKNNDPILTSRHPPPPPQRNERYVYPQTANDPFSKRRPAASGRGNSSHRLNHGSPAWSSLSSSTLIPYHDGTLAAVRKMGPRSTVGTLSLAPLARALPKKSLLEVTVDECGNLTEHLVEITTSKKSEIQTASRGDGGQRLDAFSHVRGKLRQGPSTATNASQDPCPPRQSQDCRVGSNVDQSLPVKWITKSQSRPGNMDTSNRLGQRPGPGSGDATGQKVAATTGHTKLPLKSVDAVHHVGFNSGRTFVNSKYHRGDKAPGAGNEKLPLASDAERKDHDQNLHSRRANPALSSSSRRTSECSVNSRWEETGRKNSGTNGSNDDNFSRDHDEAR